MHEQKKYKILVVDDERSNILALNHILKPEYTTLAAIDGKTALTIAEKNVPDLILLDVIMPDISGFEVLTELKKLDATRRIPVIIITSLIDVEDEERGFALGAADYITKPFHNAVVKARVRTQLQMVEYISTIEQLSMVDMLTGLQNRRGFNERMNVEWGRALREHEPLSVLMIDIDHFKRYNDEYGHLQGDVALRTTATVVKKSLKRAIDLASRFGGEEFIVLLPNTGSDGAFSLAETIRRNVQNTVIEGSNSSLTISIGVNTLTPSVETSPDSLIDGADKALYAAKVKRNQSCRL